jgi:hypothetical protein
LPIDCVFVLALEAALLFTSYGADPMAPVLGGEVPFSMCVRISFVYFSLG